ncbi:MAG: SGNH/GDSL hydrolase family protein [Nocardioidaceae bacterium]
MSRLRRTRAALIAPLALVSALTVNALAPAAHADTPSMVGLGDSYASGVGTRTYYDDSGSCQRSPYAYAVLDAERVGADLSFVACSGATTSTVLDNQLGALSSATDYVTLTVGGNDAGFVDVITSCAPPWWASDCDGAIDDAQQFITDTLPGRLDTVDDAISSAAPNATVVVVGYPRLFNGEDCNAGTWFSPHEESRLNATADLLDSTIAAAANAHGFSYVDPRSAFTGHAICGSPEWINGLSSPITESYHPNRSGQTGYADLVDDLLA